MYIEEKTLKDLEFYTILKHLSRYAQSVLGRNICLTIKPTSDIEEVKELLNLTSESKKMLQMELIPSFSGIYDIYDALKRANITSALDIQDFIDIASTLNSAKNLKIFFKKYEEEFPAITQLASYLMDHNQLIDQIYKCFDTSGNILDTASPKLKQLKDSHRDQTNYIKDKINSLLHSSSFNKFLQEPVYTIRNDRYVLPIKVEFKSSVPGIVHDSSASGVTIYIEPKSIVDLNNRLKETELEIDHEIQRILAQLTLNIAQSTQNIMITLDILSKLDFNFAKAKYSITLDASEPTLNENKNLYLKQIKHPILILNLEKVISNTIELDTYKKTLVITGANTGGKTVLLKSIGLCILMVACGLHIPADSESSIYIFESIFAEIGGQQNIEQNLSTFSAHMTNIINIINKANENSLVLLDEICAGTDPTEGTALAHSILEYLNNKNTFTVVTTHYSGLKTLAYSHKGFCNASVEFDMETLKPTYKLLMGIPGTSNATSIAHILGLNNEITKRAKEIYTSSVDDFSLMLDEIHKIQIELEKKLVIAKSKYEFAEHLKVEFEKSIEELNETKEKTLKNFKRELTRELNNYKSQIIKIIEDLNINKNLKKAKHAHSELSKIEYESKEKYDKYIENITDTNILKPIDWSKTKINDVLYLKTIDKDVILLSLPNQNNRVTVNIGNIKSTVKTSELFMSNKNKLDHPNITFKSDKSVLKQSNRMNLSIKCDLRGKTIDEGLMELEFYLDKAALSNITPVYIIHGHGSGLLRKAVRDYLNKSPYVKSFRPGENNEGGDGVSIVELK